MDFTRFFGRLNSFGLSKKTNKTLIFQEPIFSRLVVARLKGSPQKLAVIAVSTPTNATGSTNYAFLRLTLNLD